MNVLSLFDGISCGQLALYVFPMSTEGISSKELMDKFMETAEKLSKARVN